MARNLSYFIETIPNAFDVWNITHRQSYYVRELEGFIWLGNDTQEHIATYYKKDDIQGFWAMLKNLEQLPANATIEQFFNALAKLVLK